MSFRAASNGWGRSPGRRGGVGSGDTPVSGSLSLNIIENSSPVDFTALGTLDWAIWQVTSPADPSTVKSGGAGVFSTATVVGAAGFASYNDSAVALSWTDGDSPASGSSTGGLLANNNVGGSSLTGGGYSLVIPAGTDSRTIILPFGVWNCVSQFTVSLSDGSAPPVIKTFDSTPSTPKDALATIVYNASSPWQTLTITAIVSTAHGAWANVTLRGATYAS